MNSALFSVPGSAACVFLAELIDATACVHGLLLAGIERMAVGTHFKLQISASRARGKRVATAASHGDFFVFRMNAGFHDCLGRDALFQKNGARSVAAPPLFRKESPFIKIRPPFNWAIPVTVYKIIRLHFFTPESDCSRDEQGKCEIGYPQNLWISLCMNLSQGCQNGLIAWCLWYWSKINHGYYSYKTIA